MKNCLSMALASYFLRKVHVVFANTLLLGGLRSNFNFFFVLGGIKETQSNEILRVLLEFVDPRILSFGNPNPMYKEH